MEIKSSPPPHKNTKPWTNNLRVHFDILLMLMAHYIIVPMIMCLIVRDPACWTLPWAHSSPYWRQWSLWEETLIVEKALPCLYFIIGADLQADYTHHSWDWSGRENMLLCQEHELTKIPIKSSACHKTIKPAYKVTSKMMFSSPIVKCQSYLFSRILISRLVTKVHTHWPPITHPHLILQSKLPKPNWS